MELEKFEFIHFNKCASLIHQSLENKKFEKVKSILTIMSAVWRRNSQKKLLEIVVVDQSLKISIEVLTEVVCFNSE